MVPDLSRFPRLPLGLWPTPLEEAPRLGDALGRRVLVKRDDINGLGGGGNKLRKLEFLLGQAREDGVATVITFGALQTNHGRQTAAAVAKLGMRCILVLTASVPRNGVAYRESGNVVLDHLFGAEVHVCESAGEAGELTDSLVAAETAAGRETMVIPMGGSVGLGALGYVAAAEELDAQLGELGITQARVVAPLGSAGTAAGLVVGAAGLDWLLDLPSVFRPADQARQRLMELVAETAELLGIDSPSMERAMVSDRALGEGYGVPTPQVWDALALFARTEGIILDPVYTGKAAAHLLAGGDGDSELPVVFIHTGGSPGLFAYQPELAAALGVDTEADG